MPTYGGTVICIQIRAACSNGHNRRAVLKSPFEPDILVLHKQVTCGQELYEKLKFYVGH